MVQMVAWITSIAIMLLIAAIFGWVALNSTKKREYEPIVKNGIKREKDML